MTEPAYQDTPEPEWDECMDLLSALPAMPIADRVGAIETLLRNPSPGIRPRSLRMGATLLPEERLVAFVRNDSDDVLRNAGLEILKLKGPGAFPLATSLLRDEDHDVVLQAVLILDHIRDPRAVTPLRPLLHHEEPNVVQAAIVALGHLGDSRTVSDLVPFLGGDPWLQVAAVQALGDLRLQQAIAPLKVLLPDLLVGMLAAEAIARIGGREALATLAGHWIEYRDSLDPESFLGLLAHILEDPALDSARDAALAGALEAYLSDPSPSIRMVAARCALCNGPSQSDRRALDILNESETPAAELPPCLVRRADLCETLLAMGDPYREWGILLLALTPGIAGPANVADAMLGPEPPRCLEQLAEALRRIDDPIVVEASLELYLRLPLSARAVFSAALEAHGEAIGALLATRSDVSDIDRIVLEARIGAPEDAVTAKVRALGPEDRGTVVSQIASRRALVTSFPWRDWIEEDPGTFVPLLAEIVGEYAIDEFTDLLRPHLSSEPPCSEVIRAVGSLGDRDSVGALCALLGNDSALVRMQAVESLGSIGGPEARQALSGATETFDRRELRIVYRSLARCAVEEDGDLFRSAASDPDWVIRMSCAEFLSRFPTNENLPILSALAADPVPAVAQRADSGLQE